MKTKKKLENGIFCIGLMTLYHFNRCKIKRDKFLEVAFMNKGRITLKWESGLN